ncbi:hypothetical protein [Nonomuraea longicatena]|uniref:Bacterial transcriptional activator domain-containing protein n=1 Tax=Nonomuraea longicatena TaxID=83682 RepID=A0ABN1P5T7_9ACTN
MPTRISGRRTPGEMLAGLGALVVLVALVGGVPYLLLTLAGPPIGPELLDLDLLTGQVGPSTVVALLVLLVWLAWLQLLTCVVVEVYAGVRRVGMPARVPLSGGTQALANRLVSAVLLLFATSAVVVPVARLGAPPVASPPMTAVAFAAPVVEQEAQRAKKVYVVQPPHGRHHESLWEIAEKCLGDGRRYPEIYRLNKHKEQPDGSRLRMADLIRPGWVLDMPDDAKNVHVVPGDQARTQTLREHPGRADPLRRVTPEPDRPAKQSESPSKSAKTPTGPAEAKPPTSPADPAKATAKVRPSTPVTPATPGAPQGERGSGPVAKHRNPEPTSPEAVTPGRVNPETVKPQLIPAETPEPRAEGVAALPAEPEQSGGLDLVDYLAASSLAAAGLLVVLGRRRREQLWRRPFGRRLPRPQGDAAHAEVALRFGADAPGARILDSGLRLLSAELAKEHRKPPVVLAAHLSTLLLDLWVHPPDDNPPAPWSAQDGGRVWRLHAHEGRLLEDPKGAAPYPGLVSLGTDEVGRVLIDLEAAQGVINISGPNTTAALGALAVELATNRWSDRMRVLLVGFGEDLTAIAPERVQVVGSIAEALPELERAAATPDEVITGRADNQAAYLLSAVAPTLEESQRMTVMARMGGVGFVVAGEVPHATWTVEVTGSGRALLPELGFDVTAQLLPRRHYEALVELFHTARLRENEGEAVPDPEPLVNLRPPSVEVRMLGPIEIAGPPPLEEGRMEIATELLVYLAAHPGGVHPAVLGGVLWPRGVQTVVRDVTISRVADWLGEEHLFADASGRLRLGPGVRSDWALFRELVRRSHQGGDAETDLLERALSLVRGPLLSGRPRGRYAWLASDDTEYDVAAEVADAAHRLCELRLAEGDPDGAVAAVRAALLLAADDEGLWRDLLRAMHATGDQPRLRAVVDGLARRSTSHPYGGGMAPETEALVDELLPTWRIHLVRKASA